MPAWQTDSASVAKLTANWVMGEISAYLNKHDLSIAQCPVDAKNLAVLIQRLDDQTLSSKTAKTLFEALAHPEEIRSVDQLIGDLNLAQVSDDGALTQIIEGLIEEHPQQFAELCAGKTKMMGFFVGQVMRATEGKANPKQVNEIINGKL